MKKVAKFHKVSFKQFLKDWPYSKEDQEYVRMVYDKIKLPTRATSGSAGYDFYIPIECFRKGGTKASKIVTGIRCEMEEGWVLMLFPKSGLGTNYGMRLMNTTGIIDSDYFNAENEGHIKAAFLSEKSFELHAGDKFMQGVFLPYGITKDDKAIDKRTGGFGSTGR